MAMESLSIMDELDSEPTLEEINQLSSSKAPGNDSIPVEVIKCAKGTLLNELHEILCQCWREGEVPQDMRDAYKNKGDRSDCNNYCGISLLNIVGKHFAKVDLMKLRVLAESLIMDLGQKGLICSNSERVSLWQKRTRSSH